MAKQKVRDLPVIYVQCPMHSAPGEPTLGACKWMEQGKLLVVCMDCVRMGKDIAAKTGMRVHQELHEATPEALRETLKQHVDKIGEKHGLAPSPDPSTPPPEPTLEDIRRAHDTRHLVPPTPPQPPGPPPVVSEDEYLDAMAEDDKGIREE